MVQLVSFLRIMIITLWMKGPIFCWFSKEGSSLSPMVDNNTYSEKLSTIFKIIFSGPAGPVSTKLHKLTRLREFKFVPMRYNIISQGRWKWHYENALHLLFNPIPPTISTIPEKKRPLGKGIQVYSNFFFHQTYCYNQIFEHTNLLLGNCFHVSDVVHGSFVSLFMKVCGLRQISIIY